MIFRSIIIILFSFNIFNIKKIYLNQYIKNIIKTIILYIFINLIIEENNINYITQNIYNFIVIFTIINTIDTLNNHLNKKKDD